MFFSGWCAFGRRPADQLCSSFNAGRRAKERMELRVVGCHGGETPKHRTSAFVVDERLAIDAGSLTSGLELSAQFRLQACIVSHAHLDHIRDLATIADNRCQADCEPLLVAATKETISSLKKHFFNNHLWPDFSTIPNKARPTIRFQELKLERPVEIAGYQVQAVSVSHTIDTAGFIIQGPDATIAYSGDTGPTDRLWELLNAEKNLKALLLEVSFPDREQKLATVSGHHTPRTLLKDLKKLHKPKDLPTLLYHIKPFFQREVEQECARLKGLNLAVTAIGDQYVL
jgi:3',5'-cyclic-nucleotide phosphodiesterase